MNKIETLIRMYLSGAITEHYCVVESLCAMEDGGAEELLPLLFRSCHDELIRFLDSYVPHKMVSSHGDKIPSVAIIETARNWVKDATDCGDEK